jgi:hypothetical protein
MRAGDLVKVTPRDAILILEDTGERCRWRPRFCPSGQALPQHLDVHHYPFYAIRVRYPYDTRDRAGLDVGTGDAGVVRCARDLTAQGCFAQYFTRNPGFESATDFHYQNRIKPGR